VRRPLTIVLGLGQGALASVSAYQLLLLLAAVLGRYRRARNDARPPAGALSFVVLVPAHDEEQRIRDALASLRELDYPDHAYEVVVVADNCSDRTAELARAAGATVYERDDPERPGKPHALAWGLRRVLESRAPPGAVVVVDADCRASRNLLAAVEPMLVAGAAAVQVDYVVANPGESRSSALRFAGYALMNTVRPLGKSVLGLSCGLLGTGMAFSRATLERHPWSAFLLAEDREYHNVLVAGGERVLFQPDACVSSSMPTSFRASVGQQLRWEAGRIELARRWTPRLLSAGLRQRDLGCLMAGVEVLTPPQSLLLIGNGVLTSVAAALRASTALRLSLATSLAQAVFVLGGVALVRAPATVYTSLLAAPGLVATKAWIYARVLLHRGPVRWLRTPREGVA
jgi:1,2-diacylglycerol 3-beta-glucosyltransferase